MADTSQTTQPGKITPEDIERRLRAVKDGVDKKAESARNQVLPAAVGVGLLLLIIAYLLGRRVGKKRSTIVEIRRI